MAKTIIGKVGITPQGEWSASRADYNRLDTVTHEGSSYMVILKNGNVPVGTPVTNGLYWEVLAKGVDLSVVAKQTSEFEQSHTAILKLINPLYSFKGAVYSSTPQPAVVNNDVYLIMQAGQYWGAVDRFAGMYIIGENGSWVTRNPVNLIRDANSTKLINQRTESFDDILTSLTPKIGNVTNMATIWSVLNMFFEFPCNLFDKTRVIAGYALGGNGTIFASGAYSVSHMIAVKGGVNYRTSSSSLVQWFSGEGVFVSDFTSEGLVPATITAPATARWARIHTTNVNVSMFCLESTYPAVYTPFAASPKYNPVILKDIDSTTLSNRNTPVTQIQLIGNDPLKPEKNLFNVLAIQPNTYLSSSTPSESGSYHTSGFIRVELGKTYRTRHAAKLYFYTKDLTGLTSIDSTTQTSFTVTDEAAKYVRFSFFTGQLNNVKFTEGLEQFAQSERLPFEMVLPQKNLPRAIRPTATRLEVALDDLQRLEELGGKVTGGVLGQFPQIEIPFDFRLPTTIDLYFRHKEINSGIGENVIAMLFREGDMALPFAQVHANSVAPIAGSYMPIYNSNFRVQFDSITTGNNSGNNKSGLFNNQMNGADVFSIRVVTPTVADINKQIECDGLSVILKDGATVLNTWLFSAYPNALDLVTAIKTDLGASYDVRYRSSTGVLSADLAMFKANLVKLIPEYNNSTDVATGVNIYDSYDTFLAIKDTTFHKLTINMEYSSVYPTSCSYNVLIDDLQVFGNTGALPAYASKMILYINKGNGTIGTSGNIEVKDLKIYHTRPEKFRYTIPMMHNFLSGLEIPAGNGALSITAQRLSRSINLALQNGWKFITYPEWIGMVKGYLPRKDKCIMLTTDDGILSWDSIPEIRNIMHAHNIKMHTCIIPNAFDWVANKDSLNRLMRDGHTFSVHGNDHHNMGRKSYAQFSQAMELAKGTLRSNGIDTNMHIYPYGSSTPEQWKWYRNNGFAACIQVGGDNKINTFTDCGEEQFNIARSHWDDTIAWSIVEGMLKRN